MSRETPTTVIVWFKRDLRLRDHEPLQRAIATGHPVLLLAWLEPSIMEAPSYEIRHWRFVWQSIQDLNGQLQAHSNARIYLLHQEVVPTLQLLSEALDIKGIFSHEETGIQRTYDRDKAVADFCRKNGIPWFESQSNGVIRGLRNRQKWKEDWFKFIEAPPVQPDWPQFKAFELSDDLLHRLQGPPLPTVIQTKDPNFQPGGESAAYQYLQSFLQKRVYAYARSISKPEASRRGCSRISPYLTWGNLSIRQVYQAGKRAQAQSQKKQAYQAFLERLQWHCHFIQKFEMEERMEFENFNRGYDAMKKEVNPAFVEAWKQGQTGYPLVDATMRCLQQTGYVNFRMRAMVVSFLTHLLWQPWQTGADYLASLFLDFEPGIHYPQWQMQAGITGINTVRIYNPVKQALDHDPEGVFIRKWVPELRDLPTPFVQEPWKMTALEQQMYGFQPGRHYPAPIIDQEERARFAREQMWQFKESLGVQREGWRILKKHTLPGRRMQ